MKKIKIKAHLRNYLICLEDVLGDKLETRMIGDKLDTGIGKMKQAKRKELLIAGKISRRYNINTRLGYEQYLHS